MLYNYQSNIQLNLTTMNQELKGMAIAAQTPELNLVLSRFEQLNIEILELSNEIAYKLSAIKTIPVEGLSKSELNVVQEPQDVISYFYLQLSNLESSKRRLEDCFNHIKTIV